MAHFFRGNLGALLPTAAAGAFVARSLARRVAPAALVLRATVLPPAVCGGAQRQAVFTIRVSVSRGRRGRGVVCGRRARAKSRRRMPINSTGLLNVRRRVRL